MRQRPSCPYLWRIRQFRARCGPPRLGVNGERRQVGVVLVLFALPPTDAPPATVELSKSLAMYQPHNGDSGNQILALALALVAGFILMVHVFGS
jgi:hypothetical protein